MVLAFGYDKLYVIGHYIRGKGLYIYKEKLSKLFCIKNFFFFLTYIIVSHAYTLVTKTTTSFRIQTPTGPNSCPPFQFCDRLVFISEGHPIAFSSLRNVEQWDCSLFVYRLSLLYRIYIVRIYKFLQRPIPGHPTAGVPT